jgi:DNA-binding protein HU-beta
MNKQEIVKIVASRIEGATQKDVSLILDETFEAIKETVATGDKVNIAGFGAFEVKEREARTCRNPQTGQSVEVPSSKAPKFRPGKSFKDKVNE